MKAVGKHIISALTFALTLVSCADELFYDDDYIPEGESVITATVDFRSFSPALDSRAAGNAIKEISSLWLVIYEPNVDDTWTLETGGKIRLTADDHNLTTGVSDNMHPDDIPQAESQTGRASFRLRHRNGRYRIFAVANCDLSEIPDSLIDTPEKLMALPLTWDQTDIRNNSEMFGCFTNSNSSVPADYGETVTLSPNRTMHAWIRRAASKVTVAFDGSRLADGVSIYLMSASIKHIPLHCPLGTANTKPDSLINGELIKYFEGDVPPTASDFLTDYKSVVTNKTPLNASLHDEDAPSLFFYENMQGIHEDCDKRQQQSADGNGLVYNEKDNVPRGTYIEVQAIYRSTNTQRPGSGIIKYRFMLGKTITTDYNAERNFHYKLTMRFNRFANDVDWHIDYQQQEIFEVTAPTDFNYQGKVLVPNPSWPNMRHTFSDSAVVQVMSYIENDKGIMRPIEMEVLSGSEWLDIATEGGDHPYEKKFIFTVKDEFKKPDGELDIDAALQGAPPKGTENSPWNLADPDGTSGSVVNTANCYMVDAPGWYIFPMVYGNAIEDTRTNESSYKAEISGSSVLGTLVNHLNKPISKPYIADNDGCNPQNAYLVWQDANGLLRPSYTWDWDPNEIKKCPTYIKEAYGGKGGIRFYVAPESIKQGNAVIAVSDKAPVVTDAGQGKFDFPEAIWSWHIWVTRLDVDDADKTIAVTNHDNNIKLDLMPMNLGWCSKPGEKLKYYKSRECKVRFSSGSRSKTVTIVKKSHIAFTCGDSPYYQWGRKDPFIGATGDLSANKERWNLIGWSDMQNPPLLTDDSARERLTTRNALGERIRNPHKWHSPPRIKGTVNPWVSHDESYSNLWEWHAGSDTLNIHKTVYDPCPAGYQVACFYAFTGFTTRGIDSNFEPEWFDVKTWNIMAGHPTDGLFEFYTGPDKSQSIIFPQSGYRDWDDKSNTYHFNRIGYVWTSGSANLDSNKSFNLEFSRTDRNGYIHPLNPFYPCDGFTVRPLHKIRRSDP